MQKTRIHPGRENMLADIEAEARLTECYTGRSRFGSQVMAALARVPRHEFVPESMRQHAYVNSPLPIGHNQTISQPYIVALMTDLLDLEGRDAVVLEIGTGCGYQTAVLAEIAKQVYSIEIIGELAEQADLRLKNLGYANITVRHADGYSGWPEHAPYDGILVTAAAVKIPPPLIDQLKAGGRMVIPLETGSMTQDLVLVVKKEDGSVTQQTIIPVAFVPFRRSPQGNIN